MSLYFDLYELLAMYLVGGPPQIGTYEDLMCTLLAGTGSIFLVAIPFMVVWKVIKVILG